MRRRDQADQLAKSVVLFSHRCFTGAPKAFKGKVLIVNGGTENGPSRGYVTAYEADTGEQAWRFFIVPGNPADGFESEAMAVAMSETALLQLSEMAPGQPWACPFSLT